MSLKIKKTFLCLISIFAFSSCGTGTCAHSFSNWKTTKEPTCLVNGEKQRQCLLCGEYEKVALIAFGHNFVNEKCTVCGQPK